MNQPVTKQALATLGMEALDRDRVGQVMVSPIAGGVSFATALEVMEFSKLMAVSDKAVPKHLRANPGMCLAVSFQAIEWRMSPFAVANKSYEVNDRLAYESQLIHAVIESRAPLRERLKCDYEGEGPDRVCIVTGTFITGESREYRSPKFKDIRTKNSPLWRDDADQQHWYYSSRAWCRKWCPDVLLGIYSRDELAINPQAGREEEPIGPALKERLATADRSEGHQPGHANAELAKIAPSTGEILPPEKEPAPKEKPTRRLRRRRNAEQQAEPSKPETPAESEAKQPGPPTDAANYEIHAKRWIESITDRDELEARWEGEDDMRNELKVPVKVRIGLRGLIEAKSPKE